MYIKGNKKKKKFIKEVFSKLKNDKNILSATFVGSFADKHSLKNISDIDLIIILKNLNHKISKNLEKKIYQINFNYLLGEKKKLLINNTFGPLKFNSSKYLVIHLMLYDKRGHIDHAIKSPFTVYDWERSNIYLKKKISEIYKVGSLQLNDFLSARRGLFNYANDIKIKKISYRKYKFFKNKYSTDKHFIRLQSRGDKYEYYFHIVKNLILNFIKFHKKKNRLFFIEKEIKNLDKYFGRIFSVKHAKNINNLIYAKKNKNFDTLKNFDSWIINFIKDFQSFILREIDKSKKIVFLRHAKTKINDGSFLGQNRNPDIDRSQIKILSNTQYNKVYTSPLKRSFQTAQFISKNRIFFDKNLLEINYGKVEGLTIKKIKKKFPKLVYNWKSGKDPKFPSGESQGDVVRRLKIFLKKIIKDHSKKICIVTHNVLLRSLIGFFFKIEKKFWYKINIPHMLELEFLIKNKIIFPNINRKKIKILFLNLEK
jgi:broad specificity phosphatase PhoE